VCNQYVKDSRCRPWHGRDCGWPALLNETPACIRRTRRRQLCSRSSTACRLPSSFSRPPSTMDDCLQMMSVMMPRTAQFLRSTARSAPPADCRPHHGVVHRAWHVLSPMSTTARRSRRRSRGGPRSPPHGCGGKIGRRGARTRARARRIRSTETGG
jgi:hypothetical protein